MPTPHGWTDRQVKLRDKIAKRLEGKVKEPYAVATSTVERQMKARKELKGGTS